MRRALFLDFSIPLFEPESSLREYFNHLSDISRAISRTKNIKFYVALPLDFITLNKSNLNFVLDIFSTLYKEERVEFIVKDSFGVDSSVLSSNVQEFNTILSEYVVGYYFGDRRNFEGDKAIMMKNLSSFYPFSGKLSQEQYSNLSKLGYKNFFLDKTSLLSGSFIFNNQSIFVELDSSITSLLETLLDKFTFDNYISSISTKTGYEVFYIDLYKSYLKNKSDFVLNFTNLIHFLDHSEQVEYRFVDESFEMPVEKDLKNIILIDSKSIAYSEDFLGIIQPLSNYINFIKLNGDELYDEDLKNIPIWEGTSSDNVNNYLKVNFIILSLLSSSVESRLNLLKERLKAHISNLLDELQIYSSEDTKLEQIISTYRSYINKK